MPATGSFDEFVARARAAGALVVQPRMGMADPVAMRRGLARTKGAAATAVGTITLDSYTRLGEHARASAALTDGVALNGYPITSHSSEVTMAVLSGVEDEGFPVQVRHGSADPRAIVEALVAAGLRATEGGPVSYCLPYGRTPLRTSVANWAAACDSLLNARDPHVETFGGCLLGQLCPPSLLVAVSLLEAVFLAQHGIRGISLSYAQQTNADQDAAAIRALRALASELLPGVDWHVVLYAYMGVYPRTAVGADRLLADAARLAVRTGTERLIVKTAAEAHRIPTVEENVAALERAAEVAARSTAEPEPDDDGVHAEARAITYAVLALDSSLDRALPLAFERGYLDVPFCVHPDNVGRARGFIDATGRLRWSDPGALPIRPPRPLRRESGLTADSLMTALTYVQRKYDGEGNRP
ncbi:methylaspartate mutase epsilon subunit [Actinokineospora baliensis]|uniref:methylaspartate mutase n=1 Tax=Actinokineospora baliensis TaxID=547056 RepID=UPI0027DAC7F1|nr:methylaspartate mutase [Actinokineospora baliensis]MBM7775489.1 methylaspartate mutase epsilon subunit [Actinokineospora baliensis]